MRRTMATAGWKRMAILAAAVFGLAAQCDVYTFPFVFFTLGLWHAVQPMPSFWCFDPQ